MKKAASRLLRLAIVLTLIPAVLFIVCQTPPGKSAVASLLSRSLSHADGVEVHIGKISGWIPARVQIDHIEVADARGTWLTVHQAQGQLILRNLLKGRIRVVGLQADKVDLARLPAGSHQDRPRIRGRGDIQQLNVILEDCAVERLRLGAAVAGLPLEYSVRSGGIVLVGGKLFGAVEIKGDAVGYVEFDANMTAQEENRLMLRARVEEWRKPSLGMDRLSGTLEAVVDADGINAAVDIDVERQEQAGHLSTHLTYATRQLQLNDLRFDGDGWTVAGDVNLGFAPGVVDVDASASLTKTNDLRYSVQAMAQVATTNDSWAVAVQYMNVKAWNNVSVTLSGRLDSDQVDLSLELAECDLQDLPFAPLMHVEGRISGNGSIAGATVAPNVTAGLDVVRFTPASDALDELPKLDFHVAAGVSDGRLFASTTITNFVSGYLNGHVDMPCAFSLYPFRFKPDPWQSSGSLDTVLDLDVFNGLAMLDNEHVKGYLTTELSMDQGVPSGFVLIEKGAYEHYRWGVLFNDFDARIDAVADGFVIRNGTATDGGEGRIQLSGGLKKKQLDVLLSLTKAKIVRRPEVEAVVSGSVKLSGQIRRPSLTGQLMVDRADFLPDNIVTPNPAMLVNFDADAEQEEQLRVEAQSKPFPVEMDIKVDMPDQLYVNASLIDSVWGGNLRLRDASNGLSVQGAIEPRRGFVDFVGKPFQLIDGSVELDGAIPARPVLNNLTAEYSRSDITARLVLNGNISAPQCRLESTPPLPEDEILSHVLFKRDTSRISPYQAIQIASAAQQLSSGLSGPGFLYQFRRAVGVDTLELRESEVEDGDSSVAAGKYITPELYVEVSSTLGGEGQTDMTAEYEINRHFSVETSAGPRMRPGIGLNWKTDY